MLFPRKLRWLFICPKISVILLGQILYSLRLLDQRFLLPLIVCSHHWNQQTLWFSECIGKDPRHTEVPMGGIMEIKSSEEFNQIWNGLLILLTVLDMFIFEQSKFRHQHNTMSQNVIYTSVKQSWWWNYTDKLVLKYNEIFVLKNNEIFILLIFTSILHASSLFFFVNAG